MGRQRLIPRGDTVPEHRTAENMLEKDVLVIGGGPAGIAVALAVARAGLKTACVDRAPMGRSAEDSGRTVALLPASVEFLRAIGVWERLSTTVHPITEFRFLDARAAHAAVHFRAADIGVDALAWNSPNAALREALDGCASDTALIERIQPGGIVAISRREDGVLALLTDGRRVRARLLVAADGRGSATRETAGIHVRRWNHGRRAITFAVESHRLESGVCTEIHGERQTTALVPLSDGKSAVVWVLPGDRAASLLRAGRSGLEGAFNRLIGDGQHWLQIVTEPRSWPESYLVARTIVASRIALAGEAAHVLSPVGAQGLNLSLSDAAELGRLGQRALAKGLDPGGSLLLSEYARRRRADIALRTTAVEGYSLLASMPGEVASRTRARTAQAVERIPALRRMLVRGALRATASPCRMRVDVRQCSRQSGQSLQKGELR